MVGVLHSAFTSLLRSNCKTISPAGSTLRICEVSTCFIVDSCQILGGTLYIHQAIDSLQNSSGSRRPMPQAWSSWIAPPISYSWRVADEPLRLRPVASRWLSLSLNRAQKQFAGDRTQEAVRVLRSRATAPGRPRIFMIRPVLL